MNYYLNYYIVEYWYLADELVIAYDNENDIAEVRHYKRGIIAPLLTPLKAKKLIKLIFKAKEWNIRDD